MEEKWISQNEYMKRYNLGFKAVKELIATNQVEYKKIGSQYRIKIGGDTVSREIYEQEKIKRIEAESTLNLLKKILIEKEVTKDDCRR